MKNGSSVFMAFAFIVFSYFYLKTIFRAVDKYVYRPRRKSAFRIESKEIEKSIAVEAKKRDKMVKKIGYYSTKEPERFASLLANLLVNGN